MAAVIKMPLPFTKPVDNSWRVCNHPPKDDNEYIAVAVHRAEVTRLQRELNQRLESWKKEREELERQVKIKAEEVACLKSELQTSRQQTNEAQQQALRYGRVLKGCGSCQERYTQQEQKDCAKRHERKQVHKSWLEEERKLLEEQEKRDKEILQQFESRSPVGSRKVIKLKGPSMANLLNEVSQSAGLSSFRRSYRSSAQPDHTLPGTRGNSWSLFEKVIDDDRKSARRFQLSGTSFGRDHKGDDTSSLSTSLANNCLPGPHLQDETPQPLEEIKIEEIFIPIDPNATPLPFHDFIPNKLPMLGLDNHEEDAERPDTPKISNQDGIARTRRTSNSASYHSGEAYYLATTEEANQELPTYRTRNHRTHELPLFLLDQTPHHPLPPIGNGPSIVIPLSKSCHGHPGSCSHAASAGSTIACSLSSKPKGLLAFLQPKRHEDVPDWDLNRVVKEAKTSWPLQPKKKTSSIKSSLNKTWHGRSKSPSRAMSHILNGGTLSVSSTIKSTSKKKKGILKVSLNQTWHGVSRSRNYGSPIPSLTLNQTVHGSDTRIATNIGKKKVNRIPLNQSWHGASTSSSSKGKFASVRSSSLDRATHGDHDEHDSASTAETSRKGIKSLSQSWHGGQSIAHLFRTKSQESSGLKPLALKNPCLEPLIETPTKLETPDKEPTSPKFSKKKKAPKSLNQTWHGGPNSLSNMFRSKNREPLNLSVEAPLDVDFNRSKKSSPEPPQESLSPRSYKKKRGLLNNTWHGGSPSLGHLFRSKSYEAEQALKEGSLLDSPSEDAVVQVDARSSAKSSLFSCPVAALKFKPMSKNRGLHKTWHGVSSRRHESYSVDLFDVRAISQG